jgi:hypothetical protein
VARRDLSFFFAALLAVSACCAHQPGYRKAAEGTGIVAGAYVYGVAVHETTHLATAAALGADIQAFKLWPSMDGGEFSFGYVRYTMLPNDEQMLASGAPAILDTAVLATYAVLLETDNLPKSRLGRGIALTIALAACIDLAVGVGSDMDMVYDRMDHPTPLRVAKVAINIFGAVEVARGAWKLWKD